MWAVDFGTLMQRHRDWKTLTDHVLAVSEAIDHLARSPNRKCTWWVIRKAECLSIKRQLSDAVKTLHRLSRWGARSICCATFRFLCIPDSVQPDALGGRAHQKKPLEQLDGLPGWITRWGFKLASPRQEPRHSG